MKYFNGKYQSNNGVIEIADESIKNTTQDNPSLLKVESFANAESLKQDKGKILSISDAATIEFIFSPRDVIIDFIMSTMHDIERVDGGCSSCVGEIVEGFNEKLSEYGLKLQENGKHTAFSTGLDLVDIVE